MGDNWEHRITIERVAPAEPGKLYPDFLGGERRYPPEDCDSFTGYYEFLDTIAVPTRARAAAARRKCSPWYGAPYDPDKIDEKQIRTAAHAARPARRSRCSSR